jgi:3-hydroxyacyl-[acyl-carrier-protein] dehydratase
MPPPLLLDPTTIDTTTIVADRAAICEFIPHRGQMLHIDAVVSIDEANPIVVGYKDVREDEFWVQGHFPNYPILPGVIQCEAAAQLLCYYAQYAKVMTNSLLGLGGIDEARFRGAVRPGDRLIIVLKAERLDRRQTIFQCQGYVNNSIVFNCKVIGVPIPGREQMTETPASS